MNGQYYYHPIPSLNENYRKGDCIDIHPMLMVLDHPYHANQLLRRQQHQRKRQQDFVSASSTYVENALFDLTDRMQFSDREFEQRYFKASFLDNPWEVLELATKN